MSYQLTLKAKEDILDILLHGIECFGLAKAQSYRDRLEQSLQNIGNNPNLARLRTEIIPPARMHNIGVHVIAYHVNDIGSVIIPRIRHSRENWPESPLK